MADPYAWIDKSLNTLHRAHWYRSVQTLQGMAGPVMRLNGQEVINFASNDYLGLAGDPRLAEAAIAAIRTYGTGGTGSRLLSGHRDLHRELEVAIATLKQTEDAIVFSSGYLANQGVINALIGSRDLILSDQYNHASLISGARLSGATLLTYRHCDMQDLEQLLQQHRHQHRRCLIATDGVFSMDGDLCPLPEIVAIANRYEAMVLIDEAHSTGVLGEHGRGCVEHFGCSQQPLIQIGTLSKACGSLGGFATGSKPLIDFLRNRTSSWIYTTALSPADTAAALTAIRIIQAEPQRRRQLWQWQHYLYQALNQAKEAGTLQNLKPLPSASSILCIEGTSPQQIMGTADRLKEQGLLVSAVRPPTVPTSRLRITLMATHEPRHLQRLQAGLTSL